MIERLTPYEEMTDAVVRTSDVNIPWLVVRPSHWSLVRSRRLFSARTERARPDDQQLSATQAYGVIPQAEFERRVGRKVVRITQHLDKRAHVEPDDFVISMRSFQGGLERAWARGCIRSSYVVLKPAPEAHVGYFAHLFKCQNYIRALQATSNFIRDGQDLNLHNFSLVDLPLPPPDEQADIARFLDHANGKIERFIRAKRKLIVLLNEQKQAIIHHSVTRGLNPHVTLKPSDIPFIAEVPTHWEVVRFKTQVGFQEGPGIMAADFRESGVPLLRISCLAAEEAMLDGCNYLDPGKVREKWSHFSVKEGDYLLSASGSTGAVRRAGSLVTGAIPYTGIIRLWPKTKRIDMEYLRFFMSARPFADQISMAKSGVGIEHFGPTHLKRMWICLPPLEEQGEIVAKVIRETRPLNTVISRTEREIALMLEYRTRLTADVVTGKRDVRCSAANLPDVSPEESPAGEIPADNEELAVEEADE